MRNFEYGGEIMGFSNPCGGWRKNAILTMIFYLILNKKTK